MVLLTGFLGPKANVVRYHALHQIKKERATMKPREAGFLAEDKISHSSEVFDYIAELHEILWRVVRSVSPGASGDLSSYVDQTLFLLENKTKQ